MSSTPLAIEWRPQPLEINGNHDNALVIRDPVMVITTALNLPAPSDEVRQRYSRASLQQFWSLLQAGIKEELERQLGQIYNQASQYQEAKDRKSTRLNSSHYGLSRMPSSA